MKNLYEEELKFIANLALEFRLSLKNICKFLKVNSSDDNQILFYNEIIRCLKDASSTEEFKYLVYETSLESESESKRAYNLSIMNYSKYLNIKNKYLKGEVDYKEVKKCLQALKFTDVKFKELESIGFENVNLDNYADDIVKFRIKHCISQVTFSRAYDISLYEVKKLETLVSKDILKKKIKSLNNYKYEISCKYIQKKISKK